MPDGLSPAELLRYSRHLIVPEVGMEGQLKLKAAKVLLVGTGGLGAPLGLYLAAAGVGKIGLVDFDVVDFTNLQRQVAHASARIGWPKVESARAAIAAKVSPGRPAAATCSNGIGAAIPERMLNLSIRRLLFQRWS